MVGAGRRRRAPHPPCCCRFRRATASPISAPRRAARRRSSRCAAPACSRSTVSAQRLEARLLANLERLKLEAELVVANAANYDAGPFDAVLIDAPCASTGTIRRHPDVAWTKRAGDITALLAKQQARAACARRRA